MHRRYCMFNCGTEITACFGFVLARDFVAFAQGKLEATKVREMCGKCNMMVGLGMLPIPSYPDESMLIYRPDKDLLAFMKSAA